MTLALTILGVYLFLLVTWIFYVAIMSIRGRLASLHWFAKVNGYIALYLFGYPLDAVMNLIACFCFWRRPRNWLLTGTLKRMINSEDNWRCDVSAFICDNMLNILDERHC